MGWRRVGARTACASKRTEDLDRASADRHRGRQANARGGGHDAGRGRAARGSHADRGSRGGRRCAGIGADDGNVRAGVPRGLCRAVEADDESGTRRQHAALHSACLRQSERVDAITARDVRSWFDDLSVTRAGTANRSLAVLSSLLKHAKDLGLRSEGISNPCRGLRRRKTNFKAHYLSDAEFAAPRAAPTRNPLSAIAESLRCGGGRREARNRSMFPSLSKRRYRYAHLPRP